MAADWKDRFRQQITDLDASLGQPKRVTQQDFALYKRHVLELYDLFTEEVTDIPQIEITRPIITRSDSARVDVQGVIETVHALVIRFHDRRLELHPEGLNFGRSRGRVRIRHSCRGLSKFLYASLEEQHELGGDSGGGLSWYLLDRERATTGDDATSERVEPLSREAVQGVLEKVFLS